ncbi:hypothetical protein [Prevotella sp. MGM1]|uniref:hypothetical protein n=1 Tax=Prevotella sp. MGM1 TaxID=2033405 RepID=UPI000CE9CE42|nr:hypothetical protein [Prevotella sp. MGM1]GAY28142.1 hypothetical protein PvtlMGM1_1442 [Prevotella sp. MGM1]
MKNYIIEVKGEIVANAKVHYAQGWTCCDMGSSITNDSYSYDRKTHTVISNLVLNENRRAVPYAIYFTEKGIAIDSTGNISCYPGYGAAWEYYKENIAKILNLLKCEAPKEIEQTFYNGLYTDVFCILELFLSDFILCMIYSNEKVYENAVTYYKTLRKFTKEVSDIERQVHNFFFKGVVYHRFDKVEDMFMKIISIEIPDYKKLRVCLDKRNNIVHRFYFSNIDRMELVNITLEDITNLIKEANTFVGKLIENVDKVYPKKI